MRQITALLLKTRFLYVIWIMLEVLFSTGCSNQESSNTNEPITDLIQRMIVIGIDQSSSAIAMAKQDTSFVREVCNAVSMTGGLVVVYGIGDRSDQSGIRCYLDSVPVSDQTLTLSQQVELARTRSRRLLQNSKRINEFLKECQSSIFSTKDRFANTDLVGFFKKVDVLCNEPDNHRMKQLLFVYSDGVNSVDGVDTPVAYDFRSLSGLTVCLVAWKVDVHINAKTIKQFESPKGFVSFIN